uniref:ATP synthase complex subunit 8 n=2 Tax=Gyrostigma TaxID=2555504 RepID=A0A4V1HFA1_9MUSC|nr:ATP synthase F0 subunit 8 [Gyrostigma rhinocerontis]QCU81303.1 ATP synthase F0 subunit 8 [Gyrostigma rhinocerontis]
MPQMAPLSWLTLAMIFSMTFIMFNVMNYYMFTPTTPKSKIVQKFTTPPFMWKW